MTESSVSRDLSRGFPPVVGRAPRVLLLGSLPGQASLAARQYYAMPQNAFWRIMRELCSAGPELVYARRLAALRRAGIALWDVLHAAERSGSLDARIVAATQHVNDIAGLLDRHRSIELVAFNGQKAAAIFRRHCATHLPRSDLELVTLPSTSPAHAAMSPAQKVEVWRSALAPYLGPP
jgi:hypoxanthine-DNA glycosylase